MLVLHILRRHISLIYLQMATPIRRKPVPSTASLKLSQSELQEMSFDFHPLLPEPQSGVARGRDSELCGRDEHEKLNAGNSFVDFVEPGPLASAFHDQRPSSTEIDYSPPSSKSAYKELHTWRPFILRRRILIVYIAIFIALFSALEALYQVSQARKGIATTNSRKYYVWTYTPTASRFEKGILRDKANEIKYLPCWPPSGLGSTTVLSKFHHGHRWQAACL
jgi:hypothetical protein